MPLSREQLKRNTARGGSGHQWRPGPNVIRILPPTSKYFTEDIGEFAKKFFVHYNLGPEGSPPVTCPRSLDENAQCPACAMARRLWRNEATKELARNIGRKVRFLVNMVDVEQPNGIEAVEIGTKIHDPILEVALDPDGPDIMDILEGRNFRVKFTQACKETGGYNAYTVTASMQATSVKEILNGIPGWREKLDELEGKINPPPSVEDIERMVHAVVGEDAPSGRAVAPTNARVTQIGADAFPEDDGSQRKDVVVKAGSSGSARDEFPEEKASPPPQQAAAPPAEQKAPPPAQQQQASPEKSDGKPECFGNRYQPAQQRCKDCAEKIPCMEEFTR